MLMNLLKINSHSRIRPKRSYLKLTMIRKRKTLRQSIEERRLLMSREKRSELSRDMLEKSNIWQRTGHLKEKNYLIYWYCLRLCLLMKMIKMILLEGNRVK